MAVSLVAAMIAASTAGNAGSTSVSHDTEDRTFTAAFTTASVNGKVTIAKGQRRATFTWRLTLPGGNKAADELVVRYAKGGRPGSLVAHLCSPCRDGGRGRTAVGTTKPWFPAGRDVGSLPKLLVVMRTSDGRVLSAPLVKVSFRGYYG
jgi:hypothetical protein